MLKRTIWRWSPSSSTIVLRATCELARLLLVGELDVARASCGRSPAPAPRRSARSRRRGRAGTSARRRSCRRRRRGPRRRSGPRRRPRRPPGSRCRRRSRAGRARRRTGSRGPRRRPGRARPAGPSDSWASSKQRSRRWARMWNSRSPGVDGRDVPLAALSPGTGAARPDAAPRTAGPTAASRSRPRS